MIIRGYDNDTYPESLTRCRPETQSAPFSVRLPSYALLKLITPALSTANLSRSSDLDMRATGKFYSKGRDFFCFISLSIFASINDIRIAKLYQYLLYEYDKIWVRIEDILYTFVVHQFCALVNFANFIFFRCLKWIFYEIVIVRVATKRWLFTVKVRYLHLCGSDRV